MADEGSMHIAKVCYVCACCLASYFDRMFGATGPDDGPARTEKTNRVILIDRARTKSRLFSFRAGAMHGNTQKRGRRASHP